MEDEGPQPEGNAVKAALGGSQDTSSRIAQRDLGRIILPPELLFPLMKKKKFTSWVCFEDVSRVWWWGATGYHCVPLFEAFCTAG